MEYTSAVLLQRPENLAEAVQSLHQRLETLETLLRLGQPFGARLEGPHQIPPEPAINQHSAGLCLDQACNGCVQSRATLVRRVIDGTRKQIFEQLAQAAEAAELVPELNQIAHAYANLSRGLPMELGLDLGEVIIEGV